MLLQAGTPVVVASLIRVNNISKHIEREMVLSAPILPSFDRYLRVRADMSALRESSTRSISVSGRRDDLVISTRIFVFRSYFFKPLNTGHSNFSKWQITHILLKALP